MQACAWCGRGFEPRRVTAKTCSDKCRAAYSRYNRKIAQNKGHVSKGKNGDSFFKNITKLTEIKLKLNVDIVSDLMDIQKKHGNQAADDALMMCWKVYLGKKKDD